MDLTLTIRDRIAAVSGIDELVCGNSDYHVNVDADAEWSGLTAELTVEVVREYSSETLHIPVTDSGADLPAIHDAYLLKISLTAQTLTSSTAYLNCAVCITDDRATGEKAYICEPLFDVYNALMQYAADKLNGASESVLDAELAAIEAHMSEEPPDFPWEEFRQAISAQTVWSRLYGTITPKSDEVLHFTEREILANSFSISANAMTGEFLLPGGVPAKELTCTLLGDLADCDLYDAEISVTFQLLLRQSRWCDLPLGVYTVSEAQKSAPGQLAVTAYDDMEKLNALPVSKLSVETGAAYTPQEIITMIAEAAGMTYDGSTDDCVNKSQAYILSDLDDTIHTLRDLLMYTVQTINCCAYISRERKLTISQIIKKDAAASASRRQIMQSSVSAKEYQLYMLSTIIQYTEDGSTKSLNCTFPTLWPDGVYADLPENPLLRVISAENMKSRQIIALQNITDALDWATFYPAEISQTDDPSTELMEWRTFETRSGTVTIPVTAYRWTFHGGTEITAAGTEAIAGIQQTQAEKIAAGERTTGTDYPDNMPRAVILDIMQHGHLAMHAYSHRTIAHFTHDELHGEG